MTDGYSTNLTRIADLEAALADVMIGGNHLASMLIGRLGGGFASDFPPDMPALDVLEQMGSCDAYDAWCCWAAIMRARRVLA